MLEWNVFVENFNCNQIEEYNIFKHTNFKKDVLIKTIKAIKSCQDDSCYLPKLKEEIREQLRYYFWSRCEWEVVLSAFPSSDRVKDLKIDVYKQVTINYEAFYSYFIGKVFFFLFSNKDKSTEELYEEFLEYERTN